MRLFRAELRKLFTIRTPLVLLGLALVAWCVSLLVALIAVWAVGEQNLGGEPVTGESAALGGYTAGAIPSLVLTMLLGVVVMTSEFQHRTVGLLFLHTPRRWRVVPPKIAVVALCGLVWGAATTAVNGLVGVVPNRARLGGLHLGSPDLHAALAGTALAYVLWAAIGVGLGVLVRHQAGALAIALGLSFGGTVAVSMITMIPGVPNWAEDAVMVFPTLSSLVLTMPDLGDAFPPWAGALSLLAWGVLTAAGGSALLRRKEIQ